MKEITKRKILFISHSSSLGGAQKVLIDVINTSLLENSNYLCYIICPRSRQKSFEQYYQNNDKVIVKELMYRSGSANVIKSLLVLFYNIPSIFYLLWFSKKSKIDTIYINSSTCFIGVLLSLLTKIKTIFHIHEHNNIYVKVIPNYLYPLYFYRILLNIT